MGTTKNANTKVAVLRPALLWNCVSCGEENVVDPLLHAELFHAESLTMPPTVDCACCGEIYSTKRAIADDLDRSDPRANEHLWERKRNAR